MIKIEKLNPFGKMCLSMGMIPSSYSESLTYEEQLLWFCNFLEKEVIPAVNTEGEAIEELQNLYIELKSYVDNYFDNLDVQTEINNKLDDMAEDGFFTTLVENIIMPIINDKLNQKVSVASLGIEAGELTSANVDTINTYIEEHPYCSLEFGKGTYILPKSIVLLQGASISGVGNDTVLKTDGNIWAIICKGLADINSTTQIYNLTIDGNFTGNGIYIDGTRYSRCEIHDIFVVSCLYGIRNAQPSTPNTYNDSFTTGTGGNNIHDVYIFGEAPNDDTSRCLDGLVLYANDNFISNVRVSGYGNYGVKVSGSGNQFSLLKSGVNHIGVYITGGQNFGTICAEESFQNNFELEYVRNSELILKTASAGCVVDDSLPTNLQYYDVSMVNCSQNNIQINGFVAQSFAYRKAGELAMLYLQNSMLNKIDVYYGNSQVPNEYSLPIISNCAFANDIKINNMNYDKFINYTILEDITTLQASNTTLSGTYPNLTVVNNGTGVNVNFMALDLTDYIDNDLVLVDECFGTYPPQYLQISYKFSEETGAHNYTTPSQFISSYSQNGALLSPFKLKTILETLPDYINGIQNGYTIQYVRVYLKCSHAEQGTSKHDIFIAQIN